MKGFLLPIYTTIIVAIISIVIIIIAFVGYMMLFLDKNQYQYSFVFETNNAYYFTNMFINQNIDNYSILEHVFKTILTGEKNQKLISLLEALSKKYKTESLFFNGRIFNIKISNETEEIYYFKNINELVKCRANYNGIERDGFCSPRRKNMYVFKFYPGPQHNIWKVEKIDGRFSCGIGRIPVEADIIPCQDPDMWCCINVNQNEYYDEMGIEVTSCGNGGICDFRGCSKNRMSIEDENNICIITNGFTPWCCIESEGNKINGIKQISMAAIPFLFKDRIGFLETEISGMIK